MKIAVAADHGGFKMKESLKKYYEKQAINLVDLGVYSEESVDYPDIAEEMCKNLLESSVDLGILICGTGIGISIAANRHKGIRAAILYDDFTAQMAKEHNNANIMVFGGRTMKEEDVIKRIDIFLKSEFQGGRHGCRIGKLDM